MLKGRGLSVIEQEIIRQRATKHDFIVPTSFLLFTTEGLLQRNNSEKKIPMNDHAHNQVAKFLDIPKAYYDRMRGDSTDLLSKNVNHWMGLQKQGTKRLVRVLDGQVRAFLSDRYFPLDNEDIVKYLIPTIKEAGCEIVAAEITDRKLYLKALSPAITGEIKKGDIVQAGVILSNSEVGCGQAIVSPLVRRKVCDNGLIIDELSHSRHHVGRRVSEEDIEVNGIYSREAIMADIAAFLLKARDSIRAALNQSVFDRIVDQMKVAAGIPIEDIQEEVEEVTGKYLLNETESAAILRHMVDGGDATRYGLMNAITKTAHVNVTDFDRSIELERIGGEVLFRK